ncbi:O-antigen ligase family protein [Prosthecobacter sp.]|uniref:O-antigen ligase family protein n=1 Tax=Prosthecobacter sp. TaxID=1965333 RepID=UPI0037849CA3
MKKEFDQPAEPSPQVPLLADDESVEMNLSPRAGTMQEDDLEDDDTTTRTRSYDVPGPAWQGYAFAALPILACLFGAGRESWSKALIAPLLGVVLICFVPKRQLPGVALFGLLGALIVPLCAFLPADWLSQPPAWKTTLVQDWDIHLSKSLTPQAGVTLEAWLFFGVCCAWLAWCLTRGFSDLQRRAMIHTLTCGGVLICVLSILEASKVIAIPWWPRNPVEWGHGFGPFANRNHASSFAAMTCVLCAAASYDAQRRRSRLWLPFLAGFIPPLICIFMNSSRAGLILLFLGMTAWFGTVAMRRGFFQKLAVSTSLIFIIASLLVMSGGNLSKRFTDVGISKFATDNGRSTLFLETLKMSLESPWTGIGFGNFEDVFPQFNDMPSPLSRFLHPESDLLWLLSEGGLLTLLPALLVLFWIFLSTGPWFGKKKKNKSGMHDRRLRNAAAIVFGLGVVHGLGDVPNHGLGYATFMALLAGIAIRPRRLPQVASLPQRIACRLGGVALLVLGVMWAYVALGHPVLAGASATKVLRERSGKLAASGSPAGALVLLDQAIQMRPMDFHLYYERARLRLYLGQPKGDALLDFSRSRVLDPVYALTCYTEGLFWLDFYPPYAVIGWREFLRRFPERDLANHGYFGGMLQSGQQHPELREALWSLATTTELKFDYLRTVQNRDEFDRCLRSLLAQPPSDLKGLEPAQRETLFNLWYQHGDQAALISALETNRKWRDDGWRILAEHYARNSDFQKACQTAMPYMPSVVRTAPGTTTDIGALERALLYNPTDARRAIDLFQAQKSQGDIDGALRTLQKVVAMPNAPPYVRQEIATLYIMKQDFRRAWENLRQAMQNVKK